MSLISRYVVVESRNADSGSEPEYDDYNEARAFATRIKGVVLERTYVYEGEEIVNDFSDEPEDDEDSGEDSGEDDGPEDDESWGGGPINRSKAGV